MPLAAAPDPTHGTPAPRTLHGAALLTGLGAGGRGAAMVVAGGRTTEGLRGDVWLLRLTGAEEGNGETSLAARWEKLAPAGAVAPAARSGAATALQTVGTGHWRLWMFGGFTKASANKGYACELYELDVSTMDWHRLEPRQDDDEPPIAGRLGAASFVHDETFLVFGGSISGKAVNELLALGTGARVTLARAHSGVPTALPGAPVAAVQAEPKSTWRKGPARCRDEARRGKLEDPWSSAKNTSGCQY